MAGSWQMDNCCNCEGTTNSCLPTDASYAVVTGIQPAVTSDNTVDLGTQPAGNYILKYCAGAWNDGVDSPGWMAWGYGQNGLLWTVAYAYHLVFVAIGGYPYITGNTAPDTIAATPPSGVANAHRSPRCDSALRLDWQRRGGPLGRAGFIHSF